MALDFVVAGADQFAEVGTAPLTAVPISFACWCNSDAGSTGMQTLMGIVDTAADVDYYLLNIDADNDQVEGHVRRNITTSISTAGGTLTKGTDVHAAVVFASTTSNTVYRDGANANTNATDTTPVSLDAFALGGRRSAVGAQFFNGPIWEVAIWDVALTAGEVALLATGLSPKFIRPEGLIRYWDCLEVNGTDLMDQIGTNRLAITGATRIEHPRKAHLWPDPITGEPTSVLIGGAGLSIGHNR